MDISWGRQKWSDMLRRFVVWMLRWKRSDQRKSSCYDPLKWCTWVFFVFTWTIAIKLMFESLGPCWAICLSSNLSQHQQTSFSLRRFRPRLPRSFSRNMFLEKYQCNPGQTSELKPHLLVLRERFELTFVYTRRSGTFYFVHFNPR